MVSATSQQAPARFTNEQKHEANLDKNKCGNIAAHSKAEATHLIAQLCLATHESSAHGHVHGTRLRSAQGVVAWCGDGTACGVHPHLTSQPRWPKLALTPGWPHLGVDEDSHARVVRPQQVFVGQTRHHNFLR